MSSKRQPLVKRYEKKKEWQALQALQAPQARTFYIPINRADDNDRIVPWKKGEPEAMARGISERKHRETADALWVAERNKEKKPEAYERAVRRLVQPRDEPFYHSVMQHIALAATERRQLHVPVMIHGGDIESLAHLEEVCPSHHYILQFIMEELKEKGWRDAELTAGEGDIVLWVDFSVRKKKVDPMMTVVSQ